MVPSPPIFTPNNNGFQFGVNSAKRMEAGTLLINWLKRIELKYMDAESFKLALASVWTALVLDIFPTKIKKQIKVNNSK